MNTCISVNLCVVIHEWHQLLFTCMCSKRWFGIRRCGEPSAWALVWVLSARADALWLRSECPPARQPAPAAGQWSTVCFRPGHLKRPFLTSLPSLQYITQLEYQPQSWLYSCSVIEHSSFITSTAHCSIFLSTYPTQFIRKSLHEHKMCTIWGLKCTHLYPAPYMMRM